MRDEDKMASRFSGKWEANHLLRQRVARIRKACGIANYDLIKALFFQFFSSTVDTGLKKVRVRLDTALRQLKMLTGCTYLCPPVLWTWGPGGGCRPESWGGQGGAGGWERLQSKKQAAELNRWKALLRNCDSRV